MLYNKKDKPCYCDLSFFVVLPGEIFNFDFLNDFPKVIELIDRFEKEGFVLQ